MGAARMEAYRLADLVQALFRMSRRVCPFCGARASPGRLTCTSARCPEEGAAELHRACWPDGEHSEGFADQPTRLDTTD